MDPAFVDAYLELAGVPFKKNHLSDKFKELCFIAWNAAATHLNLDGVRIHMRRAIELGATPAELVEVPGAGPRRSASTR